MGTRSKRKPGRRVVYLGDSPGGAYTEKVMERAADRAPGTVLILEVRHDEWCALLGGRGPCNCEPDVVEVAP